MLEPINELWNSIKTNIKEKGGSTLYSCILFSWMAFNWKPISIFLLSDEDIYLKIRSISRFYSPERQLWDPLLYGVIIAVAFPIFNALYGFIEIIISAVISLKNNIKELLLNIMDSFKQRSITKIEIVKKVREETINNELELAKQRTIETKLKTKLIEEEFESIDEIKNKLEGLLKQNEELSTDNKELKSLINTLYFYIIDNRSGKTLKDIENIFVKITEISNEVLGINNKN